MSSLDKHRDVDEDFFNSATVTPADWEVSQAEVQPDSSASVERMTELLAEILSRLDRISERLNQLEK